jgi:hypothetical protein
LRALDSSKGDSHARVDGTVAQYKKSKKIQPFRTTMVPASVYAQTPISDLWLEDLLEETSRLVLYSIQQTNSKMRFCTPDSIKNKLWKDGLSGYSNRKSTSL